MNDEIWKPIVGYDGYEISSHGRVKSNKRLERLGHPTILAMVVSKNGSGYKQVLLLKNKIRKLFAVHRIVAKHFINNVENKPQVNHIYQNKLNNNVNNLEWVTAKQNVRYSMAHPVIVLDLNNNIIGEFETVGDAAKHLNVGYESAKKNSENRGIRPIRKGYRFIKKIHHNIAMV